MLIDKTFSSGLTYRKAKSVIATVTGTVTKPPQRVKTATGKVMAIMTIQAESERRSPYPLKLVAFDDEALLLMTCQKGSRIIATGWSRWYNGYQLADAQIIP